MSGSFRISVWDPPLIISQIIAVQCFMYVSLGLWTILFLHLIAGQPLSVDYIFRYQVCFAQPTCGFLLMFLFYPLQEVNVKDISGRLVITCYLMNALMW